MILNIRTAGRFFLGVFCLILLTSAHRADSSGMIALKGGRIIPVGSPVIEKGTILVENGIIMDIGEDPVIPEGTEVIDVSGCVMIPGLIDAFSHIGTTDISSFGSDHDEATAPVTPHLRITDALNPDNRFIPLARQNGITSALTAPGEGNLISGSSALIRLTGETPEAMIIRTPVAMHGTLGELPKMRYGTKGQSPMTRMGQAALLRDTLTRGREYAASRKDTDASNFKMAALRPVLERKIPLMVRANRLDDILTALRIAGEFNIRIILHHGAEAYRVADTLADRKVPVVLCPPAMFQMRLETTRATFENAAILHRAGVKIAFQTGTVNHLHTLLSQVRAAVANGLPADAALKSVTLFPAQIFGVEDRIGTLEKGKSADLVIFDRHPLESTAKVKMVMVAGQLI